MNIFNSNSIFNIDYYSIQRSEIINKCILINYSKSDINLLFSDLGIINLKKGSFVLLDLQRKALLAINDFIIKKSYLIIDLFTPGYYKFYFSRTSNSNSFIELYEIYYGDKCIFNYINKAGCSFKC